MEMTVAVLDLFLDTRFWQKCQELGVNDISALATDLETLVLYYYLDCEPSIVYNGQD